ncbi:MAG: 50S ribosomal protein L24e [Candidatus Hermodarchaeota archaeon]
MVKKYTCSFCGTDIEPGTGSIHVKGDGSLLYLCSSKCRRNETYLKRRARRLKWTEVYEERIRRRAQAAKARKKVKAKPKAKPKAKKKEEKPKTTPKTKPKAKPKAKKKEEKPKPKEKKAEKKSKSKEGK